jgi:hypothetical protein
VLGELELELVFFYGINVLFNSCFPLDVNRNNFFSVYSLQCDERWNNHSILFRCSHKVTVIFHINNASVKEESRRLRWAGHVARMGERRGAYRALVGKPEGRRPLDRPRHRWEDNIKMDLREVGWGGGA